MSSPLNKPEAPLNWDAASVELPPMPMIPPGDDAMSMTIAGVLPTLTAPLEASVAALQAKERMFSGKLTAAESAYQNADDSGGQSVGQLGSMLGQLGQMGQQASGPAQALGGQASSFGSMMQQAMQAFQGGGSQGGGSPSGGSQGAGAPAAGGQPSASQGSAGGSAPQPQPRDAAAGDPRAEQDGRARDDHERAPLDAAAPGDGKHGAGPAPIAPPEPAHHGDDEDLRRRM